MKNIVIVIIAGTFVFYAYQTISKKAKSIDKDKIFNVDSKSTDKIKALKEQRRKQIEDMKRQNKKLQAQRLQSYE